MSEQWRISQCIYDPGVKHLGVYMTEVIDIDSKCHATYCQY
jgi:hypothetical protein